MRRMSSDTSLSLRLLGDLPAAVRAVAAGTVTSAELVDSALERARAWEPRLHAFAWLDPGRARRLAAEADRARAAGGRLGPLHGVPIGVKDIFDTAGIPTEHGSALFRGRIPTGSADVVIALEAAGAIVLGKTVTAEMAFYHPGPTTNPWNPSRTPGGSSMGSAAAVAAGIVPAAVGSQTNGSVIRPAAFCGVVGFKPTYETISRAGVLTFSQTLDHVGGFARSVEGVAWLVAAMTGDPLGEWVPGPAAAGGQAPRFAAAPTADRERAEPPAWAQFEADLAALGAAGARIERPPLPAGLDEALPVQRTIMAVEAAANFGPAVAGQPGAVSSTLRALLDEGARTPAATYQAALRERTRLIAAFADWAAPFDAVLTLPAAGEAPGLETTGDPRFCTRWTLVGAPALTLPTGFGPAGLPLGLQLVGAPGTDRRLLAAAAWVEARRPAPGWPKLG